MFARVSTIHGSSDRVDAGIRDYREKILPVARDLAGFEGAYLLVDRKSGKFVGITLFNTEAALRASSAAGDRLRAGAAETVTATEPPTVEVYEVAVQS